MQASASVSVTHPKPAVLLDITPYGRDCGDCVREHKINTVNLFRISIL